MKLKNNILIITITGGFFVVLLALVFAYQWPGLLKKYSVSNKPVAQVETDIKDWLIYNDPDIGITFKYPGLWGRVIVENVDQLMPVSETGAKVFSGNAKYLFFDNIKWKIYLIAASDNFDQFKREAYTGTPKITDGCIKTGKLATYNTCELLQLPSGILARRTIEPVGDECSFGNTITTDMALSKDKYKGLRVAFNLPSDVSCWSSDTEMNEKIKQEVDEITAQLKSPDKYKDIEIINYIHFVNTFSFLEN